MLSGTFSTSCITTPLSSRRFCSLFKSDANRETLARVMQAAPINIRFIGDLHGQFFPLRLINFLGTCAGWGSTQIASGEGDGLPDSQAGHFSKSGLGILAGADGDQDDSSDQCEAAEKWRYGDVLMLIGRCVNRPDIQHFFPMGVIEPLVSQRQATENNQ